MPHEPVAPARRRQLDLPDLDAVLADARRLHEQGYQQAGAWNLTQICRHVAEPIRQYSEGFTFKANIFMRLIARLVFKPRLFRTRRIPTGLPAPAGTVFAPDDEEPQALAELEAAIRAYRDHPGPPPAHPIFGPFTPRQWEDFLTIHAAHHLSFLVPRT